MLKFDSWIIVSQIIQAVRWEYVEKHKNSIWDTVDTRNIYTKQIEEWMNKMKLFLLNFPNTLGWIFFFMPVYKTITTITANNYCDYYVLGIILNAFNTLTQFSKQSSYNKFLIL